MRRATDTSLQLVDRLRWVTGARMGILSVLALATILAFRDNPRDPTPRTLLGSIALALFASVAYIVWIRVGRAITVLGLAQILGDLLLWSVVVYLTGGAESAFSVLFHLTVIVAAFLFGSRGAAVAVGTGAILFCATALMLRYGIIDPPSDIIVVTALSGRELAYYLLVNSFGMAIVGALAGYLAERERRTGGELQEARRASADLAALNDDIVRSLTSGLAATDRDGTILWVNPAGTEILGRESRRTVGAALSDLLPIEGRGSHAPGEARDETTVERSDGTTVPIGYKLAPLLGGEGEARGSLLVFQDLSELRAMREKMERAERLAGLGRFAAAMAHELRNPLGSISGSLEMLKESSGLTEEDSHLADIVLREVDRLADLVTQMLEMAKPRPPMRVETDLAKLAGEVAQVIGGSAAAEDVHIDLDLPEGLVASVDDAQVRQLLWNLLRNATQASPVDGRVRLRLVDKPGAVVIEVEDSGSGVTAKEQERIFQPFYSTKRGGMGMGLVVCRQVAQGHGGSITVSNAPDGGALFTVELLTE